MLYPILVATTVLSADDYTALFREAAADTQQGKYEEAVLKYKAALAIRPGAAEALNNLALMYYEEKKYADALATAEKIWATHRELKSAALITGMAAVQCNRPREAIAPLKQLLQVDATNRDALLALASAQLALGDFDEAARTYERETGYSPDDSMAWYGRAICYENMAERASKELARVPGGAAFSKRLLAEYLQSTGDGKLAQEAFGEAEALSSSSSSEAAGRYERARELAEKSRRAFEKLTQIAPDSWQTAVFLGDVARQHGDLTTAIVQYKKAAEQQPENAAPLLGLGTAYWEMGDFDRAATYLRRTLELNPTAKQAVFELANIAVRGHRDKEAIPLLKDYLAAQPDALAARADLGRAYAHLGLYKDAAAELTKAAISDERGDIHYELAMALNKVGRTTEAEVALEQSKALRKAQLERERRLHSDQ